MSVTGGALTAPLLVDPPEAMAGAVPGTVRLTGPADIRLLRYRSLAGDGDVIDIDVAVGLRCAGVSVIQEVQLDFVGSRVGHVEVSVWVWPELRRADRV